MQKKAHSVSSQGPEYRARASSRRSFLRLPSRSPVAIRWSSQSVQYYSRHFSRSQSDVHRHGGEAWRRLQAQDQRPMHSHHLPQALSGMIGSALAWPLMQTFELTDTQQNSGAASRRHTLTRRSPYRVRRLPHPGGGPLAGPHPLPSAHCGHLLRGACCFVLLEQEKTASHALFSPALSIIGRLCMGYGSAATVAAMTVRFYG